MRNVAPYRRLADPGRDLQVRFTDFPGELLPTITGDMAAVSFLVPPWCTFVGLSYDPKADSEDRNTMASVEVSLEYRQAFIVIRPGYFSARFEQAERLELLVHEAVHIATAPLAEYAESRLTMLAGDERLCKALREELRERVEGMTQDLARAVARRAWGQGAFDPALMGPP